jgi:hypothetical protein
VLSPAGAARSLRIEPAVCLAKTARSSAFHVKKRMFGLATDLFSIPRYFSGALTAAVRTRKRAPHDIDVRLRAGS